MSTQKSTPALFARIAAALAVFVTKRAEKANVAAIARRETFHKAQLARHQNHLQGKIFQLSSGAELSGEDLKVCQVVELTDDDDLPTSEYHLICQDQRSGEYYQVHWYGFMSDVRVFACDKFYAEGQIRKAELAIQGIEYHPASQFPAQGDQVVAA